MSIKETYKHLKELLSNITSDIEKSEEGNKAASQRVRTGTVKLEKLAKLFRKESIATEKKTNGPKKSVKSAATKKSASHKSKAPTTSKSKAPTTSKSKSPKAKVTAKAKTKQAQARRGSHFSVKRATAKIPHHRSR